MKAYTSAEKNPFYNENPLAVPKCFDLNSGCTEHVVYKGLEGCEVLDTTTVLKPLRNWGGAIYLVAGLVLALAGGYSIQATLAVVIFFLITGTLFGIMFLF